MFPVLFQLVRQHKGHYVYLNSVCWELLAQNKAGTVTFCLFLMKHYWQRRTLQLVTWSSSYRDEFCWLGPLLFLENGNVRNILKKGKVEGKARKAAAIKRAAVTAFSCGRREALSKPRSGMDQDWAKPVWFGVGRCWMLPELIFVRGGKKGFSH